MPDEQGYPTRAELRRVRSWRLIGPDLDPKLEFGSYMAHLRDIWWNADWAWTVRKRRVRTIGGRLVRRYEISTGGWSGNEDLIAAMQANIAFWAICWISTRRGGHYTFEVPA